MSPSFQACRTIFRALAVCSLILAGAVAGTAAAGIRGLPYSRVYLLEDIGYIPRGSQLNFDAFGRIAVIHDGVYAVLNDTTWLNLVDTEEIDRTPMTDVAQGPDGRMYFGGRAAWGEVGQRSDGSLRTISLMPEDPPAWTRSTTFDEVVVTADGVYFASRNGLAFWDVARKQCRLFELANLSKLFRVGEKVFVSSFGRPLQYIDIDRGRLRVVPGTVFDGQQDNIVERATTLDEAHALLGSLDGRLFVFDGAQATPWAGQRRADLTGRIAVLQHLADGNIAVAITGRGVFVVSAGGELLSSLTVPQYHRVSDIASREPGVLWLINEDSIEKVLYDSALTSFGQRLGLPPDWPLVVNWRDRIYVASGGILYKAIESAPGATTHFERLAVQPPGGAWSLAAAGSRMLVGNSSGIFSVENEGNYIQVSDLRDTMFLVMAGADRCYVIGTSRIALLEWDGRHWAESAPRIPGVPHPFVVHRAGRSAWIEMGGDGVARISCTDHALHMTTVPNESWTKSLWVNIGVVGDTVILSASREERRFFDERTGTWTDRPELQQLLGRSSRWLARVRQDESGTLWATYNEGLVRFKPVAGGYQMDPYSYDLINDRYPVVHVLPGNDVWVSASRSLYHVEPSARPETPSSAAPVLVSLMDSKRNLELLAERSVDPATLLQLPYSQNNLTFRFFSGGYAWRRTPRYEFRLRPDEPWSTLDTGSLLRFPGLHEGNYRLQVRIASEFGNGGPPLTFPFRILPPWQRTWPAYLLYASLLLVGVLAAVRWSVHLARRRNRVLEQIVRERTAELESTMRKLNDETRITATLAERNRLAGEIHDSVQQGLSGAILQLDTTLKLPVVTEGLRTRLNVVRNMVSYARQEVQHAVWDMDSPLLEENSLDDAMRKLSTLVTTGAVLPVVTVSGEPIQLSRSTTHHLLRIAQEATTNAIRHAGPRRIEIRLEYRPDSVALAIADDGIGFNPEDVLNRVGHFGLRGIRARARKLRGKLTINSSPGEGTTIFVAVPLTGESSCSCDAEDSRPDQNTHLACG